MKYREILLKNKDHIKDEGITIVDFELEKRTNLCSSKNDFFVLIP